MKSLKQIIAEFTCTGCAAGHEMESGHHIFYCMTHACKPGISKGHGESCTSEANNKKFISALRAYFKKIREK